MMAFRNNRDLFAFTEELLAFLRSSGEIDLADQVAHAGRFITGSSVEFLNEVHLALKNVLISGPAAVSAEREDEIRDAIRQIDQAFKLNGGAEGITGILPDADT